MTKAPHNRCLDCDKESMTQPCYDCYGKNCYKEGFLAGISAVEKELKEQYGGLIRKGEMEFNHNHEEVKLHDNCEGCVLEEAIRRARNKGGKA